MTLPLLRDRPPAAEVDALADAVRGLLHALDRRQVDLTRLDHAPEVRRVVASLHAAELAALRWRQRAEQAVSLALVLRQIGRREAGSAPVLDDAAELLRLLGRV